MSLRTLVSKWSLDQHHQLMMWEGLVRNPQSQALPQTYKIKICTLTPLPVIRVHMNSEKYYMIHCLPVWFPFSLTSVYNDLANRVLWESPHLIISSFCHTMSMTDHVFWSYVWKKWSLYMYCSSTFSNFSRIQKCLSS